ncbi:hypothetical protein ACFL3N_00360 [Candidatus Omnitrophota bacterium]
MRIFSFSRGAVFSRGDIVFIFLIVILALVIRIDTGSFNPEHRLSADSATYFRVADQIYYNFFFFDQQRTPVYPLFISITYWLFGYKNFIAILLCQYAIGIFTCLLIYLIFKMVTGNMALSFLFAALYCIDRTAVYYESMILTEALGLALFYLFIFTCVYFYLSARDFSRWIPALGAASLLAIYCRPVFLCVIMPTVLLIALKARSAADQGSARKVFIGASSYLLIVLLPIIGTLLINYYFFKTDPGEFTTVLRNNPIRKVIQYRMQDKIPDSFGRYKEFVSGFDKIDDRKIQQKLKEYSEEDGRGEGYYVLQMSRMGMAAIRSHPFEYSFKTALLMPKMYHKLGYRSRRIRSWIASQETGFVAKALTFIDHNLHDRIYYHTFLLAFLAFLAALISAVALGGETLNLSIVLYANYIFYCFTVAAGSYADYPRKLYIIDPIIIVLSAIFVVNVIRLIRPKSADSV